MVAGTLPFIRESEFEGGCLTTCFNSNAFIFISYFDVMYMHVKAPDVDTVQAAFVSAADNKVVDFPVGYGVKY